MSKKHEISEFPDLNINSIGTLINNKYLSIYFNNIFNKIILLTQPQIKVLRSKIIKYLTITNLLKLSNLTLCNHNFQSQGKQIVPSLKTE